MEILLWKDWFEQKIFHIWWFSFLTWIRLFFFLFREAGSEGVLLHQEEGVGDTGVDDILATRLPSDLYS